MKGQKSKKRWRVCVCFLMMSSISRATVWGIRGLVSQSPCRLPPFFQPTAGRFNCVPLTFPRSPWQPCGQRGEVTAARLLLTGRAGTNDDEEDEDEEWIIRARSQHWLVATAKLQGLPCQVRSTFGNLSECVCVWTCQAREQRAKLTRQFDWTARGTITTQHSEDNNVRRYPARAHARSAFQLTWCNISLGAAERDLSYSRRSWLGCRSAGLQSDVIAGLPLASACGSAASLTCYVRMLANI